MSCAICHMDLLQDVAQGPKEEASSAKETRGLGCDGESREAALLPDLQGLWGRDQNYSVSEIRGVPRRRAELPAAQRPWGADCS